MNGARFNIVGVAFDAYRIEYFILELEVQSVEVLLFAPGQACTVVKGFGLWMPRSMELTVALTHPDQSQPSITLYAASAVSDADQKDSRIFAKRKSTGRIDGVVAVAMSIGASELKLAGVSDHDGFFNNPIMLSL